MCLATPSTVTLPRETAVRPASAARSVVLPAPDGPRSATSSPGRATPETELRILRAQPAQKAGVANESVSGIALRCTPTGQRDSSAVQPAQAAQHAAGPGLTAERGHRRLPPPRRRSPTVAPWPDQSAKGTRRVPLFLWEGAPVTSCSRAKRRSAASRRAERRDLAFHWPILSAIGCRRASARGFHRCGACAHKTRAFRSRALRLREAGCGC